MKPRPRERRSRPFGTMIRLTASVVLGSVIAWPALGVSSAARAEPTGPYSASAVRLRDLGLITGRPGGDLMLDASITRAEVVTLLARIRWTATGEIYIKPKVSPFADTESHWALRYIALIEQEARKSGCTLGLPGGVFKPNGRVTRVEALAFLMKVFGVPRRAEMAWPNDYLDGAVAAGMLTWPQAFEVLADADTPASRGAVFALLDACLMAYKPDGGKNVYAVYVKPEPPDLIVYGVPPTAAPAADLRGQVGDDAVTVLVNGEAVVPDYGDFKATVPLGFGLNTFTVEATDLVGNTSVRTLTVFRPTIPTRLEAVLGDGRSTLTAGETVDLFAKVIDVSGEVIPKVEFAVKAPTALGKFDRTTGRFTAATRPAEGQIIVSVGALAPVTIDVEVVPGKLARLFVDPQQIVMSPGSSFKFSVIGEDSLGNRVPVDPSVTWRCTGGTINAAGYYTAWAVGGASAIAETASLTAAAEVVVVAAPNHLPVFAGIAENTAQVVARGRGLAPLKATDQDLDQLIFRLVGGFLPRGITLNVDGTFSGLTETSAQFEQTAAVIEVSDEHFGKATTILTVTVTGP